MIRHRQDRPRDEEKRGGAERRERGRQAIVHRQDRPRDEEKRGAERQGGTYTERQGGTYTVNMVRLTNVLVLYY